MSLAVLSVIVLVLSSSISIAIGSAEISQSPAAVSARANNSLEQLATDLATAVEIAELTPRAITVVVPDRDTPPDAITETIRYAWSGVHGDPLTRQYNAGTTTTFVTDVHGLDLDALVHRVPADDAYTAPALEPDQWGYIGDGASSQRLMLVVSDAVSVTENDAAKQAFLASLGYAVFLVDDAASQYDFNVATDVADVAYITSDAEAALLGDKLTNVTIGVVNEHWGLVDDLLFAESSGSLTHDEIQILDDTHAITSAQTLGTMKLFDEPVALGFSDGNQADGIDQLAKDTVSAPNSGILLFAIEKGAALLDESPAPGRRVQLPWGPNSLSLNTLTNNGLVLLRDALTWAADAPSVLSYTFGDDTEHTNSESMKDIQVAIRSKLPVDGTIGSISALLDGTKQYRFALYTDDNGEPGTLIVESAPASAADGQWNTQSIPPVDLAADFYWIAVASSHQKTNYRSLDGAGEWRKISHDAVGTGFTPDWGTSDDTMNRTISIYATYTPN